MVRLFNTENLSLKGFPEDDLQTTNYKDSIKTIKAVLDKQYPITVGNVCLGPDYDMTTTQRKAHTILSAGSSTKPATNISDLKEQTEKQVCSEPHSVVISGYRKICKKNNPSDCRETLKIENSWGESWQKNNNDGWVDAKSFMDRTAYLGQNLLWIEDRENPTQIK